jgi:hypothetical protein
MGNNLKEEKPAQEKQALGHEFRPPLWRSYFF